MIPINHSPKPQPNHVDEIPFIDFGHQYHARCAEFDNVVLTGPVVNGERTPVDERQRKLMVQNNRVVFRSLLVMVQELGGSAFDLNRAVTEANVSSS